MAFEFQDREKSSDRRNQMNQSAGGNMVDTTDCLEAISVFRCWKNFLFVVTFVCLLLLETSFWLVNIGFVETSRPQSESVATLPADANEGAGVLQRPVAVTDQIKEAARQVVADINQSSASTAGQTAQPQQPSQPPERRGIVFLFKPRVQDIISFVRFINFVLIPVACLYCLTMLFALKVSLIGRLGGINHIARAFFLSLVFLVLLLPWQEFFGPVFKGVMFTPCELVSRCAEDKSVWEKVFFYGRFVAYWLLALLLLLFAQIRSIRWARATLKRLEVM